MKGDRNISIGTGPDSTGRKNIGFKECRIVINAFVNIGN